MMEALLMIALIVFIGSFTLTAQTYMESLLNYRSAPDGCSYNLYRILTLTAQTYTESLLNDESTPDSHSDS